MRTAERGGSCELVDIPARASTIAGEIDALYGFELIVSGIMTVLIFFCVFFFAIRYRRRHPDERPKPIHGSLKLEIAWSVLPFLIMLIMFAWGTYLYFDMYTPSTSDAIDVYVVGKQWMWKVQYPEGQREINELHVPVGRKVRLTMASEDVIHSFFTPRSASSATWSPVNTTPPGSKRPNPAAIICSALNMRNGTLGHDRLGNRDEPRRLRKLAERRQTRGRWLRRARSCFSS